MGSTLENLEVSVEAEKYEFTKMYPEFIKTAGQEEQKQALRTFEYANEAEKIHGGIFKELKEAVAGGADAPDTAVYLCPVCGWVGLDPSPERCPICNTPSKSFQLF